MIIKKTKFKGLLIIKQRNNKDNRGNLRETFNDKFLKKKFIFEYCTTSKKNVFRGFHFKTNDSKFTIYELSGGKYFKNNISKCMEHKRKINIDIKNITKNLEKSSYRYYYK